MKLKLFNLRSFFFSPKQIQTPLISPHSSHKCFTTSNDPSKPPHSFDDVVPGTSAVYNHALKFQRPPTIKWKPHLENTTSFIGSVTRELKRIDSNLGGFGFHTTIRVRSSNKPNTSSFWVLLMMWGEIAEFAYEHVTPNHFICVSGYLGTYIGVRELCYKLTVNELELVAQSPGYGVHEKENKFQAIFIELDSNSGICIQMENTNVLVGKNINWRKKAHVIVEYFLDEGLLLEIRIPVKLSSSQLLSQECKMKFPPERRDIVESFCVEENRITGVDKEHIDDNQKPYPTTPSDDVNVKSHLATPSDDVNVASDEWRLVILMDGEVVNIDDKIDLLDDARGTVKDGDGAVNQAGNQLSDGNQLHLWQVFFASPNEWWDNRKTKLNPNRPDFKHKDTGEALWLSKHNPPWVTRQLELLDSKFAGGFAGRRPRLTSWVYDE